MLSIKSFFLHQLQFFGLVLLCVISCSAVSEAGVMIAPMEPVAYENIGASSIPITNRNEQGSKLNAAFGQTSDLSSQSNSSVELTPPGFGGMSCWQLPVDKFSQWLVSHCHLVIPSPIPISLLKVPIEVA